MLLEADLGHLHKVKIGVGRLFLFRLFERPYPEAATKEKIGCSITDVLLKMPTTTLLNTALPRVEIALAIKDSPAYTDRRLQ